MLDLNLFHRWVAQLRVHVVYLRDENRQLFLQGIPSLATDYPDTAAALRRMAADLGAGRICCLGTCFGAYAALRYGIDLTADRVLAYSPFTFGNADTAESPEHGSEGTSEPFDAYDLRPIYKETASPPRARVVFGAENKLDAARARNLESLPTVTLEPLPGVVTHDTVPASISARRFGAQLAWLVERSG